MEFFLNSCTLLFFSTAVIATVTIDTFMNNKLSDYKIFFPLGCIIIFNVIVITCYTISMVSTSCNDYKYCNCLDHNAIDSVNLNLYQYAVFTITIIYAIGCKTLEYYKSK